MTAAVCPISSATPSPPGRQSTHLTWRRPPHPSRAACLINRKINTQKEAVNKSPQTEEAHPEGQKREQNLEQDQEQIERGQSFISIII